MPLEQYPLTARSLLGRAGAHLKTLPARLGFVQSLLKAQAVQLRCLHLQGSKSSFQQEVIGCSEGLGHHNSSWSGRTMQSVT